MTSPFEKLPEEIIQDNIAPLLDPRSLLNIRKLSKYVRKAIWGSTSLAMWKRYIKANGIPGCRKEHIEAHWVSTLHLPICSACGVDLHKKVDPSLGVRLCPKCRMTLLIEYNDVEEQEVRDSLVFSTRAGSISQRQEGKQFCLLSDYEEGMSRWGAQQSGGEKEKKNWLEWKDKKEEEMAHAECVGAYLDWDARTQTAIWDNNLAIRMKDAGLICNPELDLIQEYQGKWKALAEWPLRPLTNETWPPLLNKMDALMTRNKHATQRYLLSRKRDTALWEFYYHTMVLNDKRLADCLSSNMALTALPMLVKWKPVPLYSDLVCFPIVSTWMRSTEIQAGVDANSMPVEPTTEVIQAIEQEQEEMKHDLATVVREARLGAGLNVDPPRPRLSGSLISGVDVLASIDPDVSLLLRADALFYIDKGPHPDASSLDMLIVDLSDQGQEFVAPSELSHYKFHSEASSVVRSIMSGLDNPDVTCLEFQTMTFRCSRCSAPNLHGYEVVNHYLEAARLNRRIMARRTALELLDRVYRYSHAIEEADAAPVAVEAPDLEVDTEEGFRYRMECMICREVGVWDPSFTDCSVTVAWNMCLTHLVDEHKITPEEATNWIHEDREADSDDSSQT